MPRAPSASELIFVLLVRAGLRMGLTHGRDPIVDNAPVLAWHRADPDAAGGTQPAQSQTRPPPGEAGRSSRLEDGDCQSGLALRV